MHHIIILLSSALLYALSLHAHAACTIIGTPSIVSMDFTLPASINVPTGTPNGTVIYTTESPVSHGGHYTCTTEFQIGSADGNGQSIASGLYPIGATGLAWQYLYWSSPAVQYPGGSWYPPHSNTLWNKPQGFRIVKIGEISPDAKIPDGILGYLIIGGVKAVSLSVTNMNIIAGSCQSPDNINVDLGHPTLSELTDDNYVSFSIPLRDCPNGINKVEYQLLPTSSSPSANPASGIISLNPASTAKGAGVKIRNSTGSDFDFRKTYTSDQFMPGTVSFDISLSTKYVRLPSAPELKAGTANSEIMFLINYL
ncbi:fimbrial protein [Pseudomonas sp. A34-9]|uniref:fimbrial protein n=1 Tax=Pseudomonas sp. A34-9 TaxID=3034675 RepID=UPI00240E8FFE|nr:fimbrial protein [Pseudomonas sp. A34-9]